MADLRYPLPGNTRRVIDDPSPLDLDPVEEQLISQQASTLRTRSANVPPEAEPTDPWIVPTALWRKAQASELRRRGAVSAVRNDGRDLAFNARLDGEAEFAINSRNRVAKEPPRFLDLGIYRAMHELNERKVDEALQEIRATEDLANGPRLTALQRATLTALQAESALPVFGGGSIYGDSPGPGEALMGAGTTRSARYSDLVLSQSALGEIRAVQVAAEMMGPVFSGRQFFRESIVRTTLAIDNLTGGDAYHGNRDAAYRQFDKGYESLPRPAQLVIDELSPANIALALTGGALARLLAGAAPAGAAGLPIRAMAATLRPLGSSPQSAIGRGLAAGVATRYTYELTEGAPQPVRILMAGIAGAVAANPEAVLSPTARWGNSVVSGLGDVQETAVLRPAAEEGTVLGARIIPWAKQPARPRPQPPDIIPLQRSAAALTQPAAPPVVPTALSATATHSALHSALQRAAQEGNTLPPGFYDAFVQAEAGYRRGTAVEHVLEKIPGISWIQRTVFDPSLKTPDNVNQAILAAAGIRSQVATRLKFSKAYYVEAIQETFGTIDGKVPGVRASAAGKALDPIDLPVRNATGKVVLQKVSFEEHPYFGTLQHVLEAPDFYDLTDYQRALIRAADARNTKFLAVVDSEFGVAIGDYQQPNGGMFLSHINKVRHVSARLPDGDDPVVYGLVGRQKKRTFATIMDRRADPLTGPDFDPELNVAKLLGYMDESKILAASNQAMKYGLGGWTGPQSLNLKTVQIKGGALDGTWVKPEVFDALKRMGHDLPDWRIVHVMEAVRELRLNGDASPLTLNGHLGFASNPVASMMQLVRSIAAGNNPFSFDMQKEVLADPEGYLRFAFHTGTPIGAGTPEEYTTGILAQFLGKPGEKINQVNQKMFGVVAKSMKSHFDNEVEILMRSGLSQDAASAVAGVSVKRAWLQSGATNLSLSPFQRSIERMAATASTFIRQPIAFSAEALAGMVKMGTFQETSPYERLAVKRFFTMASTLLGASAASAAMTAEDRHESPMEAALRAITPGDPYFLKLWFNGDFSVQIGGPYRALAIMAFDRDDNGIPLSGVTRYARTRLHPGSGLGIGIVSDRDYLGNEVIRGDFPVNFWRAFLYASEQTMPIPLSNPVEAQRRGLSQQEGVKRTVLGLAGLTGGGQSTFEQTQQSRREGFDILMSDQSVENFAQHGLNEEQAAAATGVGSLDELKVAIGSRAANAAVEAASPSFAGNYQQYVADLRRRAETGDRDAAALLVGVDLQEKLTALAQRSLQTRPSGKQDYDYDAYRQARGDLIKQSLGASEVFRAELDAMRKGDNEIDRLTAEYYDLYDKATDAAGLLDFRVFEDLERKFLDEHKDKAALILGNLATAPRGAGPLEVELREVREELERTGFFKIEDDLWERLRALPSGKYQKYESFAEYRQAKINEMVDSIEPVMGETARATAENRFNATDEVARAFSDKEIEQKGIWAVKHPEIGAQAIKWGYLSNSQANLIVTAHAAKKVQPSQAAPQSGPVSTDTLVLEWESGMSYGQIGARHGMEAGAVQARLRRHYGGSPLDARNRQP